MKKIWLFIGIIFVAAAVSLTFVDLPFQKKSILQELEKELSIPQIDAYLKKRSERIDFVDVKSTAELKQLLGDYNYNETPRIYVKNFPADFDKQGDLQTFIRTLLPYILRENEILSLERQAYLKLSDKIMAHQKLTRKEADFFNFLALKYEVLKPDLLGQSNILYDKVDRISPSLAIVQALYGTTYMDENFTSPFDIYRWNKEKQYARVQYSNLAEAVEDYALELNRGWSYDSFHHKRSIYRGTRYELPGKIFARELSLYMIDEKEYVDTLVLLFSYINSRELDFATFKKGR